MKYAILNELSKRLFFSIEDVAGLLEIKRESAWVLCNRYVKEGVFVRVRNNLYVLSQIWERLSPQETFRLANFLQVPSYVSFTTALAYYEITTQVQRGVIECASLKRSIRYEARERGFSFFKLKREYYGGFGKVGGCFIATKEKAFLDALYLSSFGKYGLDSQALALEKLDMKTIKAALKRYPRTTQAAGERICKT